MTPVGSGTDSSQPPGRTGAAGRRPRRSPQQRAGRGSREDHPPLLPTSHPCCMKPDGKKGKREKKNVLVDVTRRGGSGGWTAGGSDEDRCRLILSTLTEFVFHGALAEEAG